MAFKNKVALGIHKGRQHKSDKPAKVRNNRKYLHIANSIHTYVVTAHVRSLRHRLSIIRFLFVPRNCLHLFFLLTTLLYLYVPGIFLNKAEQRFDLERAQ
jgi:hypothetical protein